MQLTNVNFLEKYNFYLFYFFSSIIKVTICSCLKSFKLNFRNHENVKSAVINKEGKRSGKFVSKM